MDYRRLTRRIVAVVVVAVLLAFIVPTLVRAHREAREVGNQQLFAQLNNATTGEEILGLRGAALEEKWLLKHGARSLETDDSTYRRYLLYTPRCCGVEIAIVYDHSPNVWSSKGRVIENIVPVPPDYKWPEQRRDPITKQQLVSLLGRSSQLQLVDVTFKHPSDGMVRVTSDYQGGFEMSRLAEDEPRQARLK